MIYELRIYRFHKGKNNKKKFLDGFVKARRFMKKYDNKPEVCPEFKDDVIAGVERKQQDPSPSLLREAIKDKFKTKVESYANQPYELRT